MRRPTGLCRSVPGTSDSDLLDPVMPRYGEASLADLLPSCLAALGVPGEPDALGLAEGPLADVRRVAVLLVDGLGWHQLATAALYAPTLADLAAGRLGAASAVTCGLPSTTPTSLATIGVGAPPGAHGILGFNVAVPGTGRVLTHIKWRDDPDPARWQPWPTSFERARAAGVSSVVVSRSAFEGTGLTVAAYRGAAYRGADTIDQLADGMLAALHGGSPGESSGGARLVYGYHPDIDHTGHVHGVGSPPWLGAAGELDRLLTLLIDGLPPDAALVVTADHGQLNVPADARTDLDTDARLRAGVALVAGEARMRYLHTVPGAREDVMAAWREVLRGRVDVLTREDAIAAGWFGPVPERHLARIGDVVVACRGRWAVLATATEPDSVATMVGFHGSYTGLEMQVPLLVAKSVGGRR